MNSRSLLLLCLTPLFAGAAEIPEPIIPAGVGVNIHFVTGNEKDLDLIAAAGIKFIRMDFAWSTIESKKSEYDWSGYDQLLANLDQRGIRAIFILDYSNPLYEETVTSPNPLTGKPEEAIASPQHSESIAAFARWAAASAKHFHGRHVLWEIWNEPNGNFWAPKPDARQYTALALAAARAVRAAEPDATIIGPASAGFPWDFLETFLKSGILQYLDAVSVHPYRDPRNPPETAAADYRKLRSLIQTNAPSDRKDPIPILSGEWGYSTFTRGVSLETQAAYAARQQLSNLLEGVPLSIWYDWKNDGPDPGENEHNFGLVSADLKPKPSYTAIKILIEELSGCRVLRRVPLPDERDYVLLCADENGHEKLAMWTLAAPHPLKLKVGSGVELELELAAAPRYVKVSGYKLK